ncbi:aldo/keto reductase [Candidatus Microthrix sp.]|jgi:aryl-alcohol dehydrogenase-like predicted oxidoreductase|uniref:aldo/keto reductase n=1 Tax=Candidatus Neomicrothrix sp. TaxID=2719034 RepID=UPI00259788BA|nr:aldo/keto reductase [Candidatus Microthrix sp.]HMS47560.1 aldo/keto reductase [Candidatus Microthrix sp.]
MTEIDHATELILGTAQFQSGYGVVRDTEQAHQSDGIDILELAARLGIAALDTAPAYGRAEDTIGQSGCGLPVHTKLDPKRSPAESLSQSLQDLRRDRIDVLYIHDSAEVLRPESRVVASASELVGEQVGSLGASVYDLPEFEAAVDDPRIGVVQVPLNLFDRRLTRNLIASAASTGTIVYVRSVLLQGILAADPLELVGPTLPLRPYVVAFAELAERVGKTRRDLAIGWVKAISGIRGMLVGAESVIQLRELVASFNSPPLDDGLIAELEALPYPPAAQCDPRSWTIVTSP